MRSSDEKERKKTYPFLLWPASHQPISREDFTPTHYTVTSCEATRELLLIPVCNLLVELDPARIRLVPRRLFDLARLSVWVIDQKGRLDVSVVSEEIEDSGRHGSEIGS